MAKPFGELTPAEKAAWSEETDPHGRQAKERGAKLDENKAPITRGLLLYFPRACSAVADLSKVGAEKYSWNGWEDVPDGINRYGDAGGRHVVLEAIEGPYDKAWLARGKRVLHATAVAWNALAKLELVLREMESGAETREPPDFLRR